MTVFDQFFLVKFFSLSLNSSCNAGCHCSTAVFSPLCDLDSQKTYFSPCHAGCSAFNAENSAYSDCSCVEGSGSTRLLANVTPTPTTIVQGYCPEDVSQCLPPLIKFILIMVVGNTVSQMSTTGNFLINYRAVEPMDKSFASGLIGTFISIICKCTNIFFFSMFCPQNWLISIIF